MDDECDVPLSSATRPSYCTRYRFDSAVPAKKNSPCASSAIDEMPPMTLVKDFGASVLLSSTASSPWPEPTTRSSASLLKTSDVTPCCRRFRGPDATILLEWVSTLITSPDLVPAYRKLSNGSMATAVKERTSFPLGEPTGHQLERIGVVPHDDQRRVVRRGRAADGHTALDVPDDQVIVVLATDRGKKGACGARREGGAGVS
eukprot:scaffold4656_cov117-Isochrysis_galbana.AAC.17